MNLLHSCRQVAELLTRRLDSPLGLIDRLRLRMHLSMCSNCSEVAKQVDQVHMLSQDLLEDGFVLDDADLAPPPHPEGRNKAPR